MPRSPAASTLTRALTASPWAWLAGAVVLTVLAVIQVRGLRLDGDYAALLAEDWPLRQELEAARSRLGASSDVVVVVDGAPAVRREFADELAVALEAVPEVEWVDDARATEFLAARALWLIPLDTLRELADAIEYANRELVIRATALLPADPDDPDAVDPWGPLRELGDRQRVHIPAFDATARDVDEGATYLFAHPRGALADAAERARVLGAIERAIADLQPEQRGVTVRLGGKLPVLLDEQRTLERDVRRATQWAFVIVIALLIIATRRVAAPIIVGVPLIVSLLVTLALARIAFGQLNILSGFILPALVGLGVDFGVHLYSRYLDHLGDRGVAVEAMRLAIDETLGACATSAATTAVAFAALLVTDLQGFREVGGLAAAGILLTFAITYTLLPALALVLTRGRARRREVRGAGLGHRYALAVVACFAVAGAFALPHLRDLRFYNDFRQFKSDSSELATTDDLERRIGVSLSPAAFIVGDRAQAAALQDVLAEVPAVRATLSVRDLVPKEIDRRAPLLDDLERRLDKIIALASPEERGVQNLERLLEHARAQPWGIDELPVQVRRRLIVSDDELVVLAFPGESLYEQDRLEAWVAGLEAALARARDAGVETTALDERRITVAVLGLLEREMPAAVGLAALAVVLLVVVRFRRPVVFLPVLLLVGPAVPILLGLLAAADIPLHAYNIIALPAIIGVGVDNAIHIQHAHVLQGPGSVPNVLATTGRAALLASATTAAGFGIDVIADHPGVRSLGWLSAAGIAGMLIVTTAVLPAALHLLDERRRSR